MTFYLACCPGPRTSFAAGLGNVADEYRIFEVRGTPEHPVVDFADWRSIRETLLGSQQLSVLSRIKRELTDLVEQHQCRVLAIDMTPVNIVPSALLGVLVSLSRGGVEIELRRPSLVIRESLKTCRLDAYFTIQN